MPSTVQGSVSWTNPFFTRHFFYFSPIHAETPHPQVAYKSRVEIAQSPVEDFERVLQINVKGTYLAVRAEIAAMKAQEPRIVSRSNPQRGKSRGVIINLGSVASHVGAAGSGSYVASKHAVLGLTKTAGSLPPKPFFVLLSFVGSMMMSCRAQLTGMSVESRHRRR